MEKNIADKTTQDLRAGTIKNKILIFSIVLFLIILVGGSTVFLLSMRGIVVSNKGNDLSRLVTIEKMFLEASVNGEIAIALKMADSPLIKQYFVNPGDPELEKIAKREIAGYRRAFAANSVFWVNDIDHKFYIDDTPPFFLDVNDPNNYWYLMTLRETELYNFNINYNPDLKVTNLWINAPVFGDNRKPIGILGTGIDLTAFINSIYKNYTSKAALYFFNEAGEITGAKDAELVAKKENISSILNGAEKDIFNVIKSRKLSSARSFAFNNLEIAVCPVPALGWYAMAFESVTTADYLNSSMTFIFMAMMALIALLFIVFNVALRKFMEPFNEIVDVLKHVATNWDLTRRIKINQNDEIGTLANYLNQTFERIKQLLLVIRAEAYSLSDTGQALAVNMNETTTAINIINSNIQNMKNQAVSQAGEINSASSSMERIMAGLGKLNENITVQVESVSRSSAAIEEMFSNIHAVTGTLVKNAESINSLGVSSEAGREDLRKVALDIQEILKESEGLLEINNVMQNISSQTNLLAMNAAIEAAHAGESGKGFAVVAGEIRKLAENSGAQSRTISDVLKKIKVSIDAISKSTDVVLQRFETMAGDVETVSNQETSIRNAMREQEEGSRQILEAISQLNSITGLVKDASAEMTSESMGVMTQSSSLRQTTKEVSSGMDQMAKSAEKINATVIKVNDISVKNKDSIDALSEGISKFRMD